MRKKEDGFTQVPPFWKNLWILQIFQFCVLYCYIFTLLCYFVLYSKQTTTNICFRYPCQRIPKQIENSILCMHILVCLQFSLKWRQLKSCNCISSIGAAWLTIATVLKTNIWRSANRNIKAASKTKRKLSKGWKESHGIKEHHAREEVC